VHKSGAGVATSAIRQVSTSQVQKLGEEVRGGVGRGDKGVWGRGGWGGGAEEVGWGGGGGVDEH
jgi:hypothetical protein